MIRGVRWATGRSTDLRGPRCVRENPSGRSGPTRASQLHPARCRPSHRRSGVPAEPCCPTRISPHSMLIHFPRDPWAHTMVYRSISGITGTPTEVSGAVFVPPVTHPKVDGP